MKRRLPFSKFSFASFEVCKKYTKGKLVFLQVLIFVFATLEAIAEPNYVYHEATTNAIGCGGFLFRSVLTPNSSQPLTIGFKVEFQSYWNQARIYYTTDGSNPTGSFGIGSGSTQVVNAAYQCGFGSPTVSEVVTGTIPALPAGTVVKYIVSAWHSAGGNEIFANGPGTPCGGCGTITNSSSLATIFSYTVLVGPIRVTSIGGTGAPTTYYASLAAAITAINGGTAHTGTINCYVDAGYSETATVGGYKITATGTSTSPIIFQKSGVGSNPLITAGIQVAGSYADGIFKIIGGDYITITGFTLQENSSNTVTTVGAANTMTEFGIGLFPNESATTNGAQNNTVQNNIISLNSLYGQSMGIFSTSASKESAIGTAADATNTAGTNSNNKIYGNTISNVALGMYFISPPTTASLMEINDIGGTSTATGNTILFGSAYAPGASNIYRSSGSYSAGIMFRNGVGSSVRYNTITCNNIAYSNVSFGVFGILYYGGGTAPTGTYTSTCSNNIISLSNTAATPITGIDFGSGVSTGAIVSNNNAITISHLLALASSGAIMGIKASYTSSTKTLDANTISITQSNSTGASSGNVHGINVSFNSGTTINITNNTISIKQSVSGTGSFTGALYYVNADASVSTLNITGNNFNSTGGVLTTIGTKYLVNHISATISTALNISSNLATIDASGAASGDIYGTYGSASSNISNYNINSNIFSIISASSGSTVGIYNIDGGTPTKTFNDNQITITGSGTTINGFQLGYGTSNIGTNTISITSSAQSAIITGINLVSSGIGFTVSNNIIANLTASAVGASGPSITGIKSAVGTNNLIYGNTIKDISTGASTGVANIAGIEISGGTTASIYSNNLYNISTNVSGTNSLLSGISFQSTPTGPFTVYNNLLSDFRMPNAPATGAAGGIFVINGARTGYVYRVYYNSIKMGSSASPLSGQANLRIVGAGFLSTAANEVDLRNNIINIYANAITGGFASCVALTGVTATAGTVATAFATTSNNNIYSINAAASNFIYAEGSTFAALKNGYATTGLSANTTNNIVNDAAFNTGCSLYKVFMGGNRETASFTEDNLVVGAQPGLFLPVGSSYAENGAQTIGTVSITSDFAAAPRTPTNDIGALQFTGTALDGVSPVITYTAKPSGNVMCVQTVIATITDAVSGVNTTAGTKPRLYFKKSTEANAFGNYPTDNTSSFNGWKYVETSNSSSPFNFTFNFALLNSAIADGNIINYFIAAQDLASTPNIALNSAVIAGGCPVSVNFGTSFSTSTTSNNFTYKSIPSSITLNATATSICVSGASTISINSTPSLSNVTYQWEESTAMGGPFVNATGTNTNASYTTNTLSSTMYYRVRVFCNAVEIGASPSSALAITVSNPSLSGTTPGGRCGTGTVLLSASGTGGTVTWYSSVSGGTALATGPTFTTPSIAVNTNYYVDVENINSGNATVGSGASTTVANDNISPFDHFYGGKKTQYLITAAELRAQGLTVGNITALSFDAVTGGALYQGFNLSIGSTILTALTTTFVTGLTNVYTTTAPAGLTTPSTGLVTITFTTPYAWDGTSNIVVQTCWSNNNAGGTGTTVKYDAPGYAATAYYRADNVIPATLCGNTSATTLTSRPKMIFAGQIVCATARSLVVATVSAQPAALSITPASVTALCSGTIQSLVAGGGDLAGLNVFSEGFETFPTANFAANGAGVSAVSSLYYMEGAKSVRLSHTNNLTTASTTNAYMLQNNINLTAYSSAQLKFSHICALENSTTTYDAGYIQYSTDGGNTWTTFPTSSYAGAGTLMTTVNSVAVSGAIFSTKSYSDWITTFTSSGSSPGATPATGLWKNETFNIPAAALSSTQFRIRFLITADGSTSYWGWQIDDIKIIGTGQAPVTWSPSTELFTNAGATTSYSGSATNTVYTKPTADRTYTATAINGYCTSSQNVAITVTPNGQWVGVTNGNWNVASNWCGGIPTATTNVIIPANININIPTGYNAVANSVTMGASSSSFTLNGNGNMSISAGGYINNTNNGAIVMASGATGAVVFPGNATVSGNTVFGFVQIGTGGVDFGSNSSIAANGSLTFTSTSGYITGNAPTYDCSSTLIYASGGTFNRWIEWGTSASGKGFPGNVLITNNTTFNYPNGSTSARAICNNLTIDAGSSFYMDFGSSGLNNPLTVGGNVLLNGNMSFGDVNGGDLKIAGNWERGSTGFLNTRGRAIEFNGSTASQTISRTGAGIENQFDYMIVNKPSGNVVLNNSPATSVQLNASSGNVLQLLNGNLNINGQSFSMNNAGGNIYVQGGTRTIIGTTASNFYINGYKTVTNATGGTLMFDNNITIHANAAINFGANLTTVNGTLQLNSGSFVDINAPYYGTSSLLKYNTNGIYDRRVEWSGLTAASPGYPNDVLVTNNTTLQPGGPGAPGTFIATPFNSLRNVTIDAGSAIYMDATNKVMTVPMRVGGTLTISGALSASSVAPGDIYVGKDWVRNTGGSFNHNTRAVFFNTAQNSTITASGAGEKFAYLYIDKDATVNTVTTLDSIRVSRELGFPRGTYDLAASHTTLQSNATHTARVGQITANALINYSGVGRFIIERYVKTPYNWQLMSIPADSTQTVKNAWAEGNAPAVAGTAGLGTNITGPGGAPNLDFSSPGYSMKYWDEVLQKFQVVTKKDTAIYNPRGYYIFVRGDRNAMSAGPYNNTVLRTKGKLFINPSFNYLVPARPNSVGNPLVSEVDFKLLNFIGGSLSPSTKIYLWDPTLNGTYGVGAYQTLTYNGTNFTITPGNLAGGAYPTTGSVYNSLQSGQAFYIEDPTMTGITFPESAKTNGLTTTVTRTSPDTWQRMSANLITVTNNEDKLVDGVSADFSSDFSNAVDAEDAAKFNNSAENISLFRDSKKLSVERHFTINNNDTMHLRMENMHQRDYRWQIDFGGRNIGTLKAYLGDRYLSTETALDMYNVNDLSFTVNANAATFAANRFYILFKQQVVLPVTFVSIAAQRQPDRSIAVKWEVANETNIQKYEVERSADGRNFTGILNSDATNSRQYTKNDLSPLAADNFYRIKAIGIAGDITYSAVVKVAPDNRKPFITIQPNPAVGKRLNVYFGNQPVGEYSLQLNNHLGQLIHRSSVTIAHSSAIKTIVLSPMTSAGNYRLSVYDKAGKLVDAEAVILE